MSNEANAFAFIAAAIAAAIFWFAGYAKGYTNGVKYCSKGIDSYQQEVEASNARICAEIAQRSSAQQRAGIGNREPKALDQ